MFLPYTLHTFSSHFLPTCINVLDAVCDVVVLPEITKAHNTIVKVFKFLYFVKHVMTARKVRRNSE
uniref:Uncharacterized protein n=1 Tax=Octopus bimaculoides TaxID=37653 RepID=A0A0L8GZ75_OCTBM